MHNRTLRYAAFGIVLACSGAYLSKGGRPAQAEDPPDGPSIGKTRPALPPEQRRAYREAILRTAAMVDDRDAVRLARARGLNVLNITWEDTGRYKNSAVGPNISDMTIQVALDEPARRGMLLRCMPVIRKPNFSDVTADVDPREVTLLVGNERGRSLRRVSLVDYLDDLRRHLHKPSSWAGRERSMLAPRDERVLVSAQACFLPVPRQGLATFNPVLFNYQSSPGNPAVLAILATREGTSATIIDNQRDAFAEGGVWGQRLFHNANGMRASLTGQRQSESKVAGAQSGGQDPNRETGLNMVLLIQVPLIHQQVVRPFAGAAESAAVPTDMAMEAKRGRSDVENAVIGHGELEGPFTEIDGLAIRRDPRFPIRVTVQFYKATSNGVVSEADVASIATQIDRVYSMGDRIGSLVTEGRTGRVTEYDGIKVQPPGWWEDFWRRYESSTGVDRASAIERLRRLLGERYYERPVTELYLRDLLREKKAN